MAGHIEDRWHTRPGPGQDRNRTRRYGQTPRYRAHFIHGTHHQSKTFRTHRDAARWLARTETEHLRKGNT